MGLGGKMCKIYIFGDILENCCHGNSTFLEKIKEKSCGENSFLSFSTNGLETWHIHWSWREDVQDIFVGCVGNCCHGNGTHIYHKKSRQNFAHGTSSFLSFRSVVIKLGTHIVIRMCMTYFQGMRNCVPIVTTYLL